jgi:hypothetical protein
MCYPLKNKEVGSIFDTGKIIEKMTTERPIAWENIPDISLYMDQMVGYMSRQLIDFSSGDKLTPAMINNYIKDGLLPRAEGKKYNREHIACLTSICVLKRILSMREIKILISEKINGSDILSWYEELRGSIDRSLLDASSKLKTTMSREELSEAALELAIMAYGQQLLCKRLVDMLSCEPEGEIQEKAKK